ncbi:hypothetical protein BDW75DRAFT_219943 [Aspergillus navahoensis]
MISGVMKCYINRSRLIRVEINTSTFIIFFFHSIIEILSSSGSTELHTFQPAFN